MEIFTFFQSSKLIHMQFIHLPYLTYKTWSQVYCKGFGNFQNWHFDNWFVRWFGKNNCLIKVKILYIVILKKIELEIV